MAGEHFGIIEKNKINKEIPPMEEKKAPRRKRLKTLADVRVYLAALINETRSGAVESGLAGKLGFLLNILRGVIVDADLEARIEKLESEVGKNESQGTY